MNTKYVEIVEIVFLWNIEPHGLRFTNVSHPWAPDLIHPYLTDSHLLSLLVQEEHPMPHHLPPLPPAHSLSLSLPCPAHLLPVYALPPAISSTSTTPHIPEPTQEAFSLSPDC